VEGQKLADVIGRAMAEAEVRTHQLLYRAILPFIKKSIPKRAAAEFEGILKSALEEKIDRELRISGPESFVTEIQNRLASDRLRVEVHFSDKLEMQMTCNEFMLTTRVQHWLDAIAGVGDE
jgi:hypothetical protein